MRHDCGDRSADFYLLENPGAFFAWFYLVSMVYACFPAPLVWGPLPLQ